MIVGVIQASSQTNKNSILFDAVKESATGHEMINFGCFPDDRIKFSYIEISIEIGILLASKAVDFIVTGCSSGQGYPKEQSARKVSDTKLLKSVKEKSQVDFITLLERLDNNLITKVLQKNNVVDYVLNNGTDISIINWIKQHI